MVLVVVLPLRAQLLPGVDPGVEAGAARAALPETEAEGRADAAGGGVLLMERLEGVVIGAVGVGAGSREMAPGLELGEGLELPDPEGLARRLRSWLGEPLDEAGLVALADAVLDHYEAEGFPVALVDVPEQSLDDGRLLMEVEIGRFGEVGVVPPGYGRADCVRAGLRLQAGQQVRRRLLDEQLWWYGRTPFREPRLFVSPGVEPASVNALIVLGERKPWRVSMGYENNGTEATGRDRLRIGAAGMLPNEQVLAWQSLSGLPYDSLNAHALSWQLPLARSHQTFSLEGAFARVRTRLLTAGGVADSEGQSWSLAARQRIPLGGWIGWRQHLSVGLEAKGTDQFVLFGAAPFAPGEVNLLQARIGISSEREWDRGAVSLALDWIGSPGNLFGGNEDADFQAYDRRADSCYQFARLAGEGWWSPGGDWRVAWRTAAQWTADALLPSEQFSAGGAESVRGVDEREYLGDKGWNASLELLTPLWQPFEGCRLRGLAFLDHAGLSQRSGSESLSGTGVGLRMQLAGHLDLRLDQGWRLDGGGSRTHLGVNLRY